MRQLTNTVILAGLLTLPAVLLAAEHPHSDWKRGKILDSKTAKSWVPTGSTTDSSGSTTIHGITIRDTELAIGSDEFAYVVLDSDPRPGNTGGLVGGVAGVISAAHSARRQGCRFIVNDDVQFYQDKGILHVLDADNKECKTEILRQERLQKTAPPAESTQTRTINN